MRWPALWPSGTALSAACTMFSAQPKAKAQQRFARRGRVRAAASAKATGQVGAGAQRGERRAMRVVARVGAGCAATRAASGPSARSAGAARRISRVARTQSLSAAMRCASLSRQASNACGRAPAGRCARGSRCSWSSSQSPRCALVRHEAGFDRGFQPFGIAEAAHRQRRRREPHQAAAARRCDVAVSGAWPCVSGRGRDRDRARDAHVHAWPCACCAAYAPPSGSNAACSSLTIRCICAQHVGQHVVGLELQVVGLCSSSCTCRLPRW